MDFRMYGDTTKIKKKSSLIVFPLDSTVHSIYREILSIPYPAEIPATSEISKL
jgi:hypothetical protein